MGACPKRPTEVGDGGHLKGASLCTVGCPLPDASLRGVPKGPTLLSVADAVCDLQEGFREFPLEVQDSSRPSKGSLYMLSLNHVRDIKAIE